MKNKDVYVRIRTLVNSVLHSKNTVSEIGVEIDVRQEEARRSWARFIGNFGIQCLSVEV